MDVSQGQDEFPTEWLAGVGPNTGTNTATATVTSPPVEWTHVDDDIIEVEGGGTQTEEFGYCYFRRPDNWISIGRADQANIEAYAEKGMRPLLRYGRFYLTPPIKQGPNKETIPQWQPSERPFDRILLAPGGPAEFPVDQVHQLGWNRGYRALDYEYLTEGRWRRHSVRIRFPQLEGIELMDVKCEVCGKPFVSEQAKGEHVAVAHPNQGTLLHLAETQGAIAKAIQEIGGSGGDNQALTATLGALTEIVRQQGEALTRLLGGGEQRQEQRQEGEAPHRRKRRPMPESTKELLRQGYQARRAAAQAAQEVTNARDTD